MKVLAGTLSDADRDLIFGANRDARTILVASTEAVIRDTRGPSGEAGKGQYVGVPQGWDHDTLTIGSISGSFSVTIPWTAIRGVWLRDDAPPEDIIDAEWLS